MFLTSREFWRFEQRSPPEEAPQRLRLAIWLPRPRGGGKGRWRSGALDPPPQTRGLDAKRRKRLRRKLLLCRSLQTKSLFGVSQSTAYEPGRKVGSDEGQRQSCCNTADKNQSCFSNPRAEYRSKGSGKN